jgi:very-short-patch-repair endonuclease
VRVAARYAGAARDAAAYVRANVDSPMESRLRMLIVLAELPEPEVNRTVRYPDGTMKLDLSYPGVRLAVEYDGRQHLGDVEQWERDPVRRDDLEHHGWRVLVVTARGIYREPGRTVTRIWRALRDRGFPRLRRAQDGWRPHFPGTAPSGSRADQLPVLTSGR